MLKVDWHVHSEYSHDSSAKIRDILKYAKRRQLDAIAITDHDTLSGNIEARRLRGQNDVQIIPGLELTFPGGDYGLHLIALYVERKPQYNNIIQAIEEIKKQGGIVVLPHPFRPYTGLFYHLNQGLITNDEVSFVLENIDYIEALNLRDRNDVITQTLQFVKGSSCPMVAGTDAHIPAEVGIVYCEVASLDDFKNATEKSVIVAHTREGATLTVDNLGPCLLRHDDYRKLKDGLQSRILSSVGKITRTLPSLRTQRFIEGGIQKVLASLERRKIEAFMKVSLPVNILKNNDSQIILTKIAEKRQ